MPHLKHIAILVESSRAAGRSLIHGITAYASRQQDWQLHFQEVPASSGTLDRIAGRSIHGMLVDIKDCRMARTIAASGIPAVDISGQHPHPDIPRVVCDDGAIAEAALEFFGTSGFRSVAFCGYAGSLCSDRRKSALVQSASVRGMSVFIYHPETGNVDVPSHQAWHPKQEETLDQWIRSLPKPIGIFCADDARALDVSAVCLEAGIAVPGDVAILGVDNDRLICEMARPHNSSIEPDTARQGIAAATLLHALLEGREGVAMPPPIPPRGIMERSSTDRVITEFPHVAAAFRYLRAHVSEPIGIKQVAAHIGVSRSLLDRDFKQAMGRTVSEELRRLRLARVIQLLTCGQSALEEIAGQTGFSGKNALSSFFKSQTGMAPGNYRRMHGALPA